MPQTILWRNEGKGVETYRLAPVCIECIPGGIEVKFRIIPFVFAILLCIAKLISDELTDKEVLQSMAWREGPRYILDAGHGGEDGGAISVSGIPESRINLEITMKLDAMMGFLGCPTILTRSEDISIHNEEAQTLREKKVSDLKNRVALAHYYPDAALISIHQNTYPEEKYHGTQVFFAPTQNSQPLAEKIQQKVAETIQPDNTRQAKQISDSVYLMNHITNRGVLIECGFLTNKEEETLLRSEEYQKKLVIIFSGVLVSEA